MKLFPDVNSFQRPGKSPPWQLACEESRTGGDSSRELLLCSHWRPWAATGLSVDEGAEGVRSWDLVLTCEPQRPIGDPDISYGFQGKDTVKLLPTGVQAKMQGPPEK